MLWSCVFAPSRCRQAFQLSVDHSKQRATPESKAPESKTPESKTPERHTSAFARPLPRFAPEQNPKKNLGVSARKLGCKELLQQEARNTEASDVVEINDQHYRSFSLPCAPLEERRKGTARD